MVVRIMSSVNNRLADSFCPRIKTPVFKYPVDTWWITDVVFSSGKGLELLAAQSKTQDASCLPALKVSDIQPTIPVTPVQNGTTGKAKVLLYYSSHLRSQQVQYMFSTFLWSLQEAGRFSTVSSPPMAWFTSEPCVASTACQRTWGFTSLSSAVLSPSEWNHIQTDILHMTLMCSSK